MNGAPGSVKRALWCRWAHRWRWNSWRGQWMRATCRACHDRDDYGRTHMDRVND